MLQVSILSKNLKIPITCKIRVFDDFERTINYAKMLESSGCKVLTVHGRTRDQKGPLTGLANWNYVKAVQAAVKIPVISNGNIQCLEDVNRCLEITGATAVMTAEGNLYNPALFTGTSPPAWEPALKYLDLVEKYPCPTSYVRGHLFKIFHHLLTLPGNNEIRINLGSANNLKEFKRIVEELKIKYLPYHEGKLIWEHPVEIGSSNFILPPWICQSYVRIPPQEHLKKLEENQNKIHTCSDPEKIKRYYEDSDGNQISRKKMKKLRRINRRPEKPNFVQTRKNLDKCMACVNPLGTKCIYKLCKKCCRDKCFVENLDCQGHRILVKTRRALAQHFAGNRNTDRTTIKV